MSTPSMLGGAIQPHVVVFVDGEVVNLPDDSETKVEYSALHDSWFISINHKAAQVKRLTDALSTRR